MNVGELKKQLSFYKDDCKIVLDCEQIHGAVIYQDFGIQTNDGDDNSPVYFEFGLDTEVRAEDYASLDKVLPCPWCGKTPLREIIINHSQVELKIYCYNCKVGFYSSIDKNCSFGTMIFKMKELNDKWNERV